MYTPCKVHFQISLSGSVLDKPPDFQILPDLMNIDDSLNCLEPIWFACRPSATVLCLRRRFGMQAYSSGEISRTERLWIHRSSHSQKLAVRPFPTVIVVEAKSPRSSSVNCVGQGHAKPCSSTVPLPPEAKGNTYSLKVLDAQAAKRDRAWQMSPIHVAASSVRCCSTFLQEPSSFLIAWEFFFLRC
jgi:hypothetical protein